MNSILKTLIKRMNVPNTKKYLAKLTEQFGQENPSLTDLQTTLANYKIDSLAVQIGFDELSEIPLPSLLLLDKQKNEYVIIEEVGKKEIGVRNYRDKTKTYSSDELNNAWSGYALLLQKNDYSSEPNYEKHLRAEQKSSRLKILRNFIIGVSLISIVGLAFLSLQNSTAAITRSLFLLLHSVGFVFSAILLSGEIFKENVVFKKACTALGSNSSCSDTVSEDKKLPFKWLTWSEIGAFYFLGGLIFLFLGQSLSSLTVISLITSFGIFGVVWSLYYQKFVQKKWCMLCLVVMGVLLSESMIGGFFLFSNGVLNGVVVPTEILYTLIVFAFSYSLPISLWYVLKPSLTELQKQRNDNKILRGFKYDYHNFKILLQSQRKLESDDYPQDFVTGNADSAASLLVVSRPTCPPCVRAKPLIDELVENYGEYVRVSTLHLATSPETKDYQEILKLLPQNYSEEEKRRAISNHYAWISHHQINHTPAYFINGYLLPPQYDISDLKFFLVQLSNDEEDIEELELV